MYTYSKQFRKVAPGCIFKNTASNRLHFLPSNLHFKSLQWRVKVTTIFTLLIYVRANFGAADPLVK